MAILRSNSNKAKTIIRNEIKDYGWNSKSLKSQIDDFKKWNPKVHGYYSGGKVLVQEGNFAVYNSQTEKMLGKIYGKQNVTKWSNDKKWNTYKHLLGREINQVCSKGSMSLNSNKKKRK